MWPHTGRYVLHQDERDPTFTYYTFTPCPLRNGRLYEMEDELTALLTDAHQKLGFLKGMAKYAPNKQAFCDLMLLKESTYSVKIDYKTSLFDDVLHSFGTGNGNIEAITNVVLAYEDTMNQQITNQTLSQVCEIALYGNEEKNAIDIRRKQTFLKNVRTNLLIYNPTAPDELLSALETSIHIYLKVQTMHCLKLLWHITNLRCCTHMKLLMALWAGF